MAVKLFVLQHTFSARNRSHIMLSHSSNGRRWGREVRGGLDKPGPVIPVSCGSQDAPAGFKRQSAHTKRTTCGPFATPTWKTCERPKKLETPRCDVRSYPSDRSSIFHSRITGRIERCVGCIVVAYYAAMRLQEMLDGTIKVDQNLSVCVET